MSAYAERIYGWLLIAPAVLPLVFVNHLLYPYLAPKLLLLHGLGILLVGLFVYLVLSGRPFFYARLRVPLSWIPAALLVVAYVTSWFGIDFYRSFWSFFERGDGLLMLTIIVFYFYLILISTDRTFLVRLVKTVAVVGALAAAVGFLQWIAYLFHSTVPLLPESGDRVGSTLGNAAFFASYLGVAVFLTIASAREWGSEKWRRVAYGAAGFQAFVAVLTATRGTILALALAGVLWLGYRAWMNVGSARKTAAGALIALAVVTGLFLVFRDSLVHSSFEPLRRVASISTTDTTVASRLFIWKNVFQEAVQRPLLGVGAEHIQTVFDRVYDPALIVEQWFDRSHNAFLDYFVQYGIFGVLLYVMLILALFFEAMRRVWMGEGWGIPLALAVVVYAAQNFFVFDTAVLLWLLLALYAALIAARDTDTVPTRLSLRLPPALPVVCGLVFVPLLYPVVWTPLLADSDLASGYLYHVSDVARANATLEKGFALSTYADIEYGYIAYSMYTNEQIHLLKGDNLLAAYQYALEVLSANYERYPYDTRTATYLGHVLDSAPPGVTVDDALLTRVLGDARALSPRRAQPWYLLANISLRKADALTTLSAKRPYYQEAITLLEEYVALEPTLAVPRYTLVNLYYALGDRQAARNMAASALPLYTEPDVSAAEPAAKFYIVEQDWPNAAKFLEDVSAENPDNFDAYYDLAKVSYLAGKFARAEEIAQDLRVRKPGLLETDENFLAAITAYERSQR